METLEQDKKLLIEKCIRSNRKFQNNEDLYEEIFDETCKNSVALLSSVTSESTAEIYLKRIVTNSISNVLRNSERSNSTFNSGLSNLEKTVKTKVVDKFNPEFSAHRVIFRNIDIEDSQEDLFAKREVLKNMTKILNKIEAEEAKENYITIFKLRYQDGMTQSEIAENLGISQSEVAKKIFELMYKVRECMN